MSKLNDTQLIILSTAAQRENRSLHPLPPQTQANAKVIGSLIDRGFAEERETNDTSAVSRIDGDIRFGGCCQSNANRPPLDAVRALKAAA
jgi:hypothetical protein